MLSTPWGIADYQEQLAEGIISCSTSSHGGIYVSPELNVKIHEAWRTKDGFYEEDCEWGVVAFTFPEAFPKDNRADIIKHLKNWMPSDYMAATGEQVTEDESYILSKECFQTRNANNYLPLSAFGDWHEKVPEGFVAVHAGRGGRLSSGMFPEDTKYFLVPASEYRVGDFVIDEARHKEIPAFN